MILTVTANPTIDRAYFVPALPENRVIRGTREVATPSGKGIDASIALHALGEPTVALSLNAGHTGRALASMLDDMSLCYDFVEALGETRTVPVIVDEARDVHYTITAPTLTAEASHLAALLARIDVHLPAAHGLICGGSLPPGLPTYSYAKIIGRARKAGLLTLLDVSGAGLRDSLAGCPDILKINQFELADFAPDFAPFSLAIERGENVDQAVKNMASRLRPRLGDWVARAIVISLGERGVLAVTCDGIFHAHGLAVPVASTNGAGDAMDAGVMLGLNQQAGDWPHALGWGVAMASAAVMEFGTSGLNGQKARDFCSQVRVEWLDA